MLHERGLGAAPLMTVFDAAEQNGPIYAFAVRGESWPFEETAAFRGKEEQHLAMVRLVRDEIEARTVFWVEVQT